jgi:hypothetical protein
MTPVCQNTRGAIEVAAVISAHRIFQESIPVFGPMRKPETSFAAHN